MNLLGFRERMIAVTVLPAALIATVLATYFLLLRYGDAERDFVRSGTALIKLFTPATEYGIFSGNTEELLRLATALSREPDVSGVAIYGGSGMPLVSIGRIRLTRQPQDLPDGETGTSDDGATQWFHAKLWRTEIRLDDPLGDRGRRIAVGSVTMELSRVNMLIHKREMMVVTLIVAFVTLALGILLALRLSSSLMMPVLSLQKVVGRIRGGDLEARVVPHPDGVLGSLEIGVNDMADALKAGRDRMEDRIAAATAELHRKRDEAERASLAKSRFLAAASHDLRQPLHALTLFVEELQRDSRNGEQERLARRIGAAVGSIDELLGSLLDVSRADLGTIRPDIQPVRLDGMLGRVVSTHLGSARERGLRLRLRQTSLWGLSDPALLYRMVSNLLSNAIRYTERGGVLVGMRRAGENIRIEVWDTGIGIPFEHQSLVFDEFFQVANSERDPNKGLGLGLSLVERLSRLLGHPVAMRSVAGQGSVFSITLPRCPATATENGPGLSTPAGGLQARVLVLSADLKLQETLGRLLEGWGCEVVGPASYEADRPATLPPDLAICEDNTYNESLPLLRDLARDGRLSLVLVGTPPPTTGECRFLAATVLARPLQPAKLRALIKHLLDDAEALTID